MGWTFVTTAKTAEEFIGDDLFAGRVVKLHIPRDTPLAGEKVGYAAVGVRCYPPERESYVHVMAFVILFDDSIPNRIGLKDMCEDMEPYYYDCPVEILELLDEPVGEYAVAWREKCWERYRLVREVPFGGFAVLR